MPTQKQLECDLCQNDSCKEGSTTNVSGIRLDRANSKHTTETPS
jgi:hypothetical protein